MENKNLGIGVLCLIALALLAAHLITPPALVADEAVMGREYQVATTSNAAGGEALYILDQRSGQVAVFTYDTTARTLRVRSVRPMDALFAE